MVGKVKDGKKENERIRTVLEDIRSQCQVNVFGQTNNDDK